MLDIDEWVQKCKDSEYNKNETIKIYGELPAPYGDVLQFENELMQRMARHVTVSQK